MLSFDREDIKNFLLNVHRLLAFRMNVHIGEWSLAPSSFLDNKYHTHCDGAIHHLFKFRVRCLIVSSRWRVGLWVYIYYFPWPLLLF